MQLLLEAGADVQKINERGLTMLPEHGVPEEVELLLKKKLDPNTLSEGESLLERAISYSFQESSAKIAILLIDYGANVHAQDANQRIYLHRTRNPQLMAKLIEKGLDVNGKDVTGKTPIQYFNQRKDKGAVKAAECLVAHGANIRDLNPMSNLVAASSVLKQKFQEIGVSTERIIPALQIAIVRKDKLEQIASLITSENVNAIDYQGHTPLHYAATTGQDAIISLLLQYRVNVNATDVLGNTPLHYAAGQGHCNSVKILLEAGAEPHLKNASGKTPLALANAGAIHAILLGGRVDEMDNYGVRFPHASKGPNFEGVQQILANLSSKAKMQNTPPSASANALENKQKAESDYWETMRTNRQKLEQDMPDSRFTFADFYLRVHQDANEALRIHGNPFNGLLSRVPQTQAAMQETATLVILSAGTTAKDLRSSVATEDALSEDSDNDASVDNVKPK